jgi:hypothetical protein
VKNVKKSKPHSKFILFIYFNFSSARVFSLSLSPMAVVSIHSEFSREKIKIVVKEMACSRKEREEKRKKHFGEFTREGGDV